MKHLTALLIIALVGLAGCSRRTIPSVEAAIRKTNGVLAHSGKKVDIVEFLPLMRRATWTDSHVFWKTSVEVLLADGTKIRFERLAPMFRIEGIEGTFLITEEDSATFEKLRNEIVLEYLP